MRAIDFEYAEKRLSDYGLILCRFGDEGLKTTTNGAQIKFNTVPVMSGAKNSLISTQYDDCLTATLQICNNPCSGGGMEISSAVFRELTKWLSRKKFLKFKILDEDYIDLYYEAKIDISRIEIDGKLVGLELEILTNRPFALKEPRTVFINCAEGSEIYGWEKHSTGYESDVEKLGYVTSRDENAYPSGVHTDGYQYISIGQVYKASLNDTSYEEGYIYPEIEITIGNIDDKPANERNLTIHNSIENRETYIANVCTGEVITMDYPVIQSSISSHNIQNDFNWNFFRIANTYDNSRNDLIISLPCSIKVSYSPIIKVGL